ncbi:MAG: hypothetical protein MHM6MM_001535 [Cercozoa sp. M6MM]
MTTPLLCVMVQWKTQLHEISLPPAATVSAFREAVEEATGVPSRLQTYPVLRLRCGQLFSKALPHTPVSEVAFKKHHASGRLRVLMVGRVRTTPPTTPRSSNSRRSISPKSKKKEPKFGYKKIRRHLDPFFQERLRLASCVDTKLAAARRYFSSHVPLRCSLREKNGRPYPLIVLDIDCTVFDMHARDATVDQTKRPHTDAFMRTVYRHFDICIWSQTSLSYLEQKVRRLGLLHPDSEHARDDQYRIALVIPKNCMFRVLRDSLVPNSEAACLSKAMREKQCTNVEHVDKNRTHVVKPLEIIWSHFGQRFNASNTLHIDDLERNFALNPRNGVKISAYKDSHETHMHDRELAYLGAYLAYVACLHAGDEEALRDFRQLHGDVRGPVPFNALDHSQWRKHVMRRLKRGDLPDSLTSASSMSNSGSGGSGGTGSTTASESQGPRTTGSMDDLEADDTTAD